MRCHPRRPDPAGLPAEGAIHNDLPDLARWMLGLWIGAALGVAWSDVELDDATVEVDWKLIRIKGESYDVSAG